MRGHLPGPGHHDRGRTAPQRRHPANHPLRYRHGEMHLLRPVPGGLPGRCHRGRSEFRVRHRDARGALLRQGASARQRRPLGTRDREEPRTRCALQVTGMIIAALFFYLFAAICVASAVMVIASRNPVHSVLFLILAFVNASGLFILMGAEFLAMILVVVYVGAVAVLFLFVIMMLDVDFAELRQGFLNYLPIGLVIGAIFLAELLLVGGGWVINPGVAKSITSAIPANVSNTEALGLVLYTKYIHYFQLAGMVLLVAMIGAIVLTLRHKVSVKRQDINVQNARTPELAMSVRKVASGQGLQEADAPEWVQ